MMILRVIFAVLAIVLIITIPAMIIKDKKNRKDEPIPSVPSTPSTPETTLVEKTKAKEVIINKIKIINNLSQCESHTGKLAVVQIVWDYEDFTSIWTYPDMGDSTEYFNINPIKTYAGDFIKIDELCIDAHKTMDEFGPLVTGTPVSISIGDNICTRETNSSSVVNHISVKVPDTDAEAIVIKIG